MVKKLLAFLVLAAGLTGAALADEAAIKRTIEGRFADFKVESVKKTPFAGLYEVRLENLGEVLFTDENVSFFIQGVARDANDLRDLTNFVQFADLPFAQSFKIVRGKGTRQLAYFSDPRCPYCKRFDQEMTHVDDLTVHVFLIPIIAPDSAALSKAIWCSPDRAKAWLDLMLKDVMPTAKANCDTPLDKNIALSRKYRVTGTPTLIFADGQRVSGWMPADKLSKMLDETSGSR